MTVAISDVLVGTTLNQSLNKLAGAGSYTEMKWGVTTSCNLYNVQLKQYSFEEASYCRLSIDLGSFGH